MSFPQYIERLNDIGRQLAAVYERARAVGDAIYGPRLETVSNRDTPPVPSKDSLDNQFSDVCNQFEIVVDNLRSEISRVEDAILSDSARATGLAAKTPAGY